MESPVAAVRFAGCLARAWDTLQLLLRCLGFRSSARLAWSSWDLWPGRWSTGDGKNGDFLEIQWWFNGKNGDFYGKMVISWDLTMKNIEKMWFNGDSMEISWDLVGYIYTYWGYSDTYIYIYYISDHINDGCIWGYVGIKTYETSDWGNFYIQR